MKKLLLFLILLLMTFAVSAGSYFESEHYKELLDVQVGEIYSAKGKGVYISRGEETIKTLAPGNPINCNDAINTQYEGDEVKIKHLESGDIFTIAYPQDMPLNQIQQFGFNKMDIPPLFAQYGVFSCVDKYKKVKEGCGFFSKLFKKCEEETEMKLEEGTKSRPEKGTIMVKKGRVLIERGIDIIPSGEGTRVRAGDTVIVEEGAEVKMMFDDGGIVHYEIPTRFTIPLDVEDSKKPGPVSNFFGSAWQKFKGWVKPEHFEQDVPTATAGVRG